LLVAASKKKKKKKVLRPEKGKASGKEGTDANVPAQTSSNDNRASEGRGGIGNSKKRGNRGEDRGRLSRPGFLRKDRTTNFCWYGTERTAGFRVGKTWKEAGKETSARSKIRKR